MRRLRVYGIRIAPLRQQVVRSTLISRRQQFRCLQHRRTITIRIRIKEDNIIGIDMGCGTCQYYSGTGERPWFSRKVVF